MLLNLFFVLVQAYLPFAGPISMGQGGAGRAAIDVVESLYLNPAAVAINDKYFMGGSYLESDLYPGVNGNQRSFIATDGNPQNLLPASFGYRYTKLSVNSQEILAHSMRLALAKAISKISFGLSLDRASWTSDGLGFEEIEYQLDLGVLYSLNEKILLGLVARNVLSPNQTLPTQIQTQKDIAIGAHYMGGSNFSVRWDVIYPTQNNTDNHFVNQLGIDSKFFDEFHFRVGYELDDYIGQSRYSLGTSWEGPRLKIAYAFQQTTRNGTNNRHMIDLWLNF